MRNYRVSFFKRLADSTGHCVDACQATLEVSAPDQRQAVDMAHRRFAEQRRITLWSLRADYTTVEPAGALAVSRKLVREPAIPL